MNIATIWKEFNKYQDECEKKAADALKDRPHGTGGSAGGQWHAGTTTSYVDMSEYGVVSRTIENALTWYNNK